MHEPRQAPPPEIIDDQEEYEVEEILDAKYFRRTLKYLVKWKGYDYKNNSWEPEENLQNAQEALSDFKRKFPAKIAPPQDPKKNPKKGR